MSATRNCLLDMAYNIHWTRRASSDIDSIFHFYSENASILVASRRLHKIKKDIAILKYMPNIGRLDDKYPHTPNYRYLNALDYRIYYFVEEKDVFIAAIWDYRQGGSTF